MIPVGAFPLPAAASLSLRNIAAAGPLCEPTARQKQPSSSCVGESPLPGVGDHNPDNFDPPPAGRPRLRGRETVAHEESQ